ncbi:helix-turn-helix domain-containing protein [Sphaerisporangium aureirubrum]|uniref:Scr1 family TA system antitoxin-like transcriptional regulator n=1 Tax=Sphaerisporangium aureirubrum TaxID=1544736 RepID=A0ABW1NGP6_9ACTN
MSDEAYCDQESPRLRFGVELRRFREEAELSQAAIAARLKVTQTHVSRLEMGKRTPQLSQAETLDRVFGLGERGYFVKLRERITERAAGPGWYMRWVEEIEPEAVVLRSWDPLLVPGLLQTPAYARCLFSAAPDATPDEIESRVQARMRRKMILDRERPPVIWITIDEWVLRRPIGDVAVMREQLDYILEVVQRHNMNIQVVPGDAPCLAGLSSGFVLAQLPDRRMIVSVESAGRGEVSADHELVARLWGYYDKIRSEACSARTSLKMIKDVRNLWNATSGALICPIPNGADQAGRA